MRGQTPAMEGVVRVKGTLVGLLLLVGLWAAAPPVAAHHAPAFEFEVIPPYPTPSDDITLKLFGVMGCTAVPSNPQVEIVGFEIHIATSAPGVCGPLETEWLLLVPIGPLPAGLYHVTVTFSVLVGEPPVPGPPGVLGEGDFSVQPLAELSGCLRAHGAPLGERPVILQQQGERRRRTMTDAGGCFTFQDIVPGKAFQIRLRSPAGSVGPGQ